MEARVVFAVKVGRSSRSVWTSLGCCYVFLASRAWTNLIDLDELSLRCRDKQAREYIQEAVASYKAGAFRSCIVSTWIAVVLDFLHKLKELEMTGDARAKAKLEEFEKIRAAGDTSLKEALDFERGVLDVAANDFELLSPLEKEDL